MSTNRPLPLFLFAVVEICGVSWLASYLFLPELAYSRSQVALRLGIGAAVMLHTFFLARKLSSGVLAIGGLVGWLVYAVTVIIVLVPR